MRILTFLHSFEAGGVERIALRLVRRWRDLGVDALLVMGRTDGAMAHDVGAGLEILTPPHRALGVAHWETLWMIIMLPRAIRMTRPDIIFCAGNTYAIVAVAMKLVLGRTCPPIIAKVSNDLDRYDAPRLHRTLYHLWLRWQSRFIDHFIGMEVPMRDEITNYMRVAPARVSIVPDPALSNELIARLRDHAPYGRLPNEGRRFVTIGRLAPQKNIAMMLRAFGRGAGSHDRLTIFGEGNEREALTALAAHLNIAERVEFRGYVAEPASILPMFDILLLSSDYEGVPAVILEALAANVAIIATACSRSMSTLLKEGALGTLIDVGDETMFAAAIANVRPGTQDRHLSLAQAERFTIEYAADAYLGTMSAITGESVSPQKSFAMNWGGGDMAASG
jgi:glycosyltransferase involved in cell wall biosynthesis